MTDTKNTNKSDAKADNKLASSIKKTDKPEGKKPSTPSNKASSMTTKAVNKPNSNVNESAKTKTDSVTPKVTPSSSAAASTAKTTPKTTAPAAPKQSGNKLSIVAIALAIAIGGGLYYLGQQQVAAQAEQVSVLKQELAQLKGELNGQLSSSLKQTQNTLAASTERTTKNSVVIEQQSADIASIQRSIAESKGHSPSDWLLTESDYLVKMAGRKLWLEHDLASASQLLLAADKRIAELNDPSLTNLRQAFATDITTLRAIPVIDRDGLVLRLSSLEQEIDALPLKSVLLPDALATEDKAVSTSAADWKENLQTSAKQFMDSFITYRTRDGSVTPLLSPKQDFYLQENLKSKLETAIKSVYREQGDLYRQSLTMAKEWASEFYNLDDPKVQSFIATLEQLEKQQIQVTYPTELKSQPIITDVISQRLRNKVLTIGSSEDPA
ncbi:uroporphyrinogen-III C-methyltransferase [Vibrio sp. SS-MA-C1-2]|uniref:uroporphyrinogen-III C-methyltransferase n=1 Tax=Vibrio sp. SS-MA-C1-2 TaxID=2908646 RepID=UPI001F34C98F|nr:uroporphyrinogen-III C-methyltransferase [Vibrio sp. SS-MA-C1-2]UJF19404.1 uroporphyrinogen-III C-methyltransferase [Vibrio sp. SS-MA-C1-2]